MTEIVRKRVWEIANLEYELSLRHVPERLYTKTGRQIAEKRATFMHEFYDRLGKEMGGQA